MELSLSSIKLVQERRNSSALAMDLHLSCIKLVQERRNFSVLAMELCLSCINPLICDIYLCQLAMFSASTQLWGNISTREVCQYVPTIIIAHVSQHLGEPIPMWLRQTSW